MFMVVVPVTMVSNRLVCTFSHWLQHLLCLEAILFHQPWNWSPFPFGQDIFSITILLCIVATCITPWILDLLNSPLRNIYKSRNFIQHWLWARPNTIAPFLHLLVFTDNFCLKQKCGKTVNFPIKLQRIFNISYCNTKT